MSAVTPFYFHLIKAFSLVPVPTFYPLEGRDGPWLVGDGIDLWSAPNERIARMVAVAIDVAGMDPYCEPFGVDSHAAAGAADDAAADDAADDAAVDSRVLLSFRLPFVGGTVAIAHSRVKSDPFRSEPFDCGFHGAVLAMAAGMIAGLSLCAMIKTAQFNRCQAGTSGDPARIAQCAKWLR